MLSQGDAAGDAQKLRQRSIEATADEIERLFKTNIDANDDGSLDFGEFKL